MRGYKSVWQSGWLPPHTHTHPHALVQARLPDWPKFCVFKKVFGQLFVDYLVFGTHLYQHAFVMLLGKFSLF